MTPWIENAFYLRLPSGPPMQGDIWTNLPIPYSHPPFGRGLLITPRCDLAHDKSPVVNYLPLISMDEYISQEGGFTLLQEELFRVGDAYRKAADPLHVRELTELGVPFETIVRSELADLKQKAEVLGKPLNRLTQAFTAFQEHHDKAESIEKLLLKTQLSMEDVLGVVKHRDLNRHKLEVARNTVVDLHFLPPCPPFMTTGSVVLLRRIVTCGITLLRTAERCISQSDWDRARAESSSSDLSGSQLKPERLLRLRSPYLEALMFRFSFLFGRIGVRDIDRTELEEFVTQEGSEV